MPTRARSRRLARHVAAPGREARRFLIAAGFVHGVLNSDNIAITAQSFDYGPWRFTPFWDGHFTAAYFDHAGLYSFGRQPEAIHWDLVQLALSLRAIAEADALTPRLETFPHLFQKALRDALFARLGIRPGNLAKDMRLVAALEEALAQETVGIDRFFFDWRGGRLARPRLRTRPRRLIRQEAFETLAGLLASRARSPARSIIPIGPIPAPAPCISTRSRRSGRRSTRRTIGRRFTPSSRRCAGWARRSRRKCLKNPPAAGM